MLESIKKQILPCCWIFLAVGIVSCQQKMAEQPSYRPLAKSDAFKDGRSARSPVEGTVARGVLKVNRPLYTGKRNGKLLETFPVPITKTLLLRGQERFNIYCAPCHDRMGTGTGMIVRRGYYRPPSYHTERLRTAPPGHFFQVIAHGFGVMPAYSQQVTAEDRWAIIAYIRALQLSQNAPVAKLPENLRRQVESIP